VNALLEYVNLEASKQSMAKVFLHSSAGFWSCVQLPVLCIIIYPSNLLLLTTIHACTIAEAPLQLAKSLQLVHNDGEHIILSNRHLGCLVSHRMSYSQQHTQSFKGSSMCATKLYLFPAQTQHLSYLLLHSNHTAYRLYFTHARHPTISNNTRISLTISIISTTLSESVDHCWLPWLQILGMVYIIYG